MKMKTITSLMAFVLAAITLRSAEILKVLECHDEVVRHGLEKLILPKEVEFLVGASNVDHFISNFGNAKLPAMWNSVGYFNNKYRLSLQVPISLDYDKCQPIGATDSAMVQINEVTQVEVSKSGIAGARMEGQWSLNENEWKWLVRNRGDWSVVKIPILTNAPVKDFELYVRQMREPIRNRKEGFDIPIKKALETVAASATGMDQPPLGQGQGLRLADQSADLRFLHSRVEEVNVRVRTKTVVVDVRGLVFTKQGPPLGSHLVPCEKPLSLGTLLESLSVDITSLGGIQLRVFKRNQILQTSRFMRHTTPDEVGSMKAVVLEPGDVVLFTTQE